eukprot:365059-Chlamydomonas_euryale.AAC.14
MSSISWLIRKSTKAVGVIFDTNAEAIACGPVLIQASLCKSCCDKDMYASLSPALIVHVRCCHSDLLGSDASAIVSSSPKASQAVAFWASTRRCCVRCLSWRSSARPCCCR